METKYVIGNFGPEGSASKWSKSAVSNGMNKMVKEVLKCAIGGSAPEVCH